MHLAAPRYQKGSLIAQQLRCHNQMYLLKFTYSTRMQMCDPCHLQKQQMIHKCQYLMFNFLNQSILVIVFYLLCVWIADFKCRPLHSFTENNQIASNGIIANAHGDPTKE